MAGIKLLALDMDGTLFDSRAMVAGCYRQALADLNLPWPPPAVAAILAHIGKPVPAIMQAVFPQASADQQREISLRGLELIVAAITRREGMLYDGVPEVLARLAADCRLAIVSNARPPYLEAILATYGLRGYFAHIGSIADAPPGGDKRDILRAALAAMRQAPAATVMVGDRAADYDAARALGLRFIGCRYGHGAPGEWPDADAVIDDIRDLPAALDRL